MSASATTTQPFVQKPSTHGSSVQQQKCQTEMLWPLTPIFTVVLCVLENSAPLNPHLSHYYNQLIKHMALKKILFIRIPPSFDLAVENTHINVHYKGSEPMPGAERSHSCRNHGATGDYNFC